MWSIAIGAGIGLLLAIHGFAHWQVTTLWGSRPESSSWLLGRSAAGLGTALWAAALLGFLLAAVGVAFHFGWWRPVTIAATVVSLLAMALFWNRRLWIGTGLDLGVLVGLLALRWPPPELLGA
jgi:hypothetical protein